MKTLGLTLDIANPDYKLSVLRILTRGNGKEIDLMQIADIRLLEQLLEMRSEQQYDRVVIYDLHELDSWEDLKELTNVCKQNDLEFSFLKQDLHSDEKIELSKLIFAV
ncbi:hypothetical protein [Oceanobacillus sp. CAU 1775]